MWIRYCVLIVLSVSLANPAWAAKIGGGGGGGGVSGLSAVLSVDRIDGDAINEASALAIGSTAADAYMVTFYDATDGLIHTCKIGGVLNDCNKTITLLAGKFFGIIDASGNPVFRFLPSGSTPKEKYPFFTGHYPLKSVWISAANLTGDGTNCPTAPSIVTLNSGPKGPTFICLDNNGSRLNGWVLMPEDWDGGTVTFTHVYMQTAADTSALHGDVAAQCRGNGETVSSTWGTEVAIDDAAVTGSSKNDWTTSAAVTPAGTCAPGDMLYFYYELDATGTTTAVATLHHIGFRITYSVTSLSQ